MKIHLLRHAKTNQTSPTGNDFDRELLPKGFQQCMLLKCYLSDKIEKDCLIFVSSSERTKQTASLILNQLSLSNTNYLKELYLMDGIKMLAFVNQLNTPKDICIIGHNEGISEFASYIIDEQITLKTGGYVCVKIPFSTSSFLSKSTGSVIDFYRPDVVND
jgi:phosphohistidine phosphatase